MFWSIIKSIFLLIATPIAAFLIRQLIIYLKLNKYRSQGIRCYYAPIFGIRKAVPGGAILEKVRKMVDKKVRGDQLVAGNSLMRLEPFLYITGSQLFRPFLEVENKYFKRTGASEKTHPNKSFFFEKGELALSRRAIFAEFFKAKNLKKMIPRIEAFFEESFKNLAVRLYKNKVELDSGGQLRLKQGVKVEDLEWKKVDFKPFLKEPFDKIINFVLFGSKSSEDSPKFDGDKPFNEAAKEFNLLKKGIFFNLDNLVFGGKLSDWKLTGASRKVEEQKKKIYKTMKNFFENRTSRQKKENKNSDSEDFINLSGLMFQYNQKQEEGGKVWQKNNRNSKNKKIMDFETIIDTLRTFHFAGYDIAKGNAGIALLNLSLHPKIREEFLKDVELLNKQDPEIRDYDSAEYITKVVKENLRLFGPSQGGFPRARICTKTCKIGGYKIYKGSLVSVRTDLFNTDPEIYDKPFEFNPERFGDKKLVKKATHNLSYVPFSSGSRSCQGQYLGEILIKTLLRTVLTFFEIRWDRESVMELISVATLEPRHINLELKPKISKK